MKDKIKKLFDNKNLHCIESLIYILAIVIVVIANVFGPIWIRMLPLLFILGIIGKISFNRPVVTTVFGSIVSICIIYLSGVTNLLENIIASGIFTLYIALGEFCGSKIHEIYSVYIKERGKKDKNYILNVSLVVVICIITTLFHNYTDSNIFTYNSCKEKLEQYLSSTYPNDKFNIVNARYTFESEDSFKFSVRNIHTESNYNFVVYVDNELDIYDGISQRKKSKEENIILEKVNILLTDKYKEIKRKINKKVDGYEINLIKEVETIKDNDVLNYSCEVCDIIETIIKDESLNKIETINITLIDKKDKTKNRISTIYVDSYKKNMEEGIQKGYTYIMKSLNIEYID